MKCEGKGLHTEVIFADGKDCPACDSLEELERRNAEVNEQLRTARGEGSEIVADLRAKLAKATKVAESLLEARAGLLAEVAALKRERDDLVAKLNPEPADHLAAAVAELRALA